MKIKSFLFVVSIFLVSCQTAQAPLTNKTNNNFNKKAIENNDRGVKYLGDWFFNDVKKEIRRGDEKPISTPTPDISAPLGTPTPNATPTPVASVVPNGTAVYSENQNKANQNRAKLDDVSGGFIAESYNIEEDDTLYPLSQSPLNSWQSIPTNSGYSKPSGNGCIVNDGKPYGIVESVENSSLPDLTFASGVEPTSNINSYTLNQYITTNNYKYIQFNNLNNFYYSSSTFINSSKSYLPINSWKTKGDYQYTYNKDASFIAEFSGTNISVMTKKGKNPGWNNLMAEVYKKLPNGSFSAFPERVIENIDMYNPTEIDYELKFGGFRIGDYKLILKTSSVSRSQGKNSFLMAVGKVKSYPYVQYQFEGKNIAYKAFKYNTCGTVNVTVDDQDTKQVSLYSTNIQSQATISEYVFGARLNSNKKLTYDQNNQPVEIPHIITIEATGEKAKDQNGNIIANSGTDINIDQLGILPQIEGNLKEDNYSFNLFVAKGNDFGKADVYIGDTFSQTIDLNESIANPPNPNFSGLYIQTYLSPYGRTKFTLVPAFDQNMITGKYKISFDAYSRTEQIAIFNFTAFDSGKLTYQATTGQDKGNLSLSFYDGSFYQPIKSLSLFSPDSVPSLVTTGTSTEFDIYPNSNQSLTVIPSRTKHPSSTSYNANISKIEFKSLSNQNLDMDLICTP